MGADVNSSQVYFEVSFFEAISKLSCRSIAVGQGSMTTLVKSQLNPLADSFFPAYRPKKTKTVYKNKRISEFIVTESKFESKTNRQRSGKQDSNEDVAKLESYREFILKDGFYCHSITSISTGFKNSSIIDQKSCMIGNWPTLPKSPLLEKPNSDKKSYMLQNSLPPRVECSNDYNQELVQKSVGQKSCMLDRWDLPRPPLLQKPNVDKKLCVLENLYLPMLECPNDNDQTFVPKSNATITVTPKIDVINETLNEEENECICPPMFGWVVPPDFTGNPFNFKYECSKKYPHSHPRSQPPQPQPDTNINEWTLDECYSAMQDIVTDVIDTISVDSNPTTDWDEGYNVLKDCLEVSTTKMAETGSNEMERDETESSGFDTAYKALEAELMDDGVHPLLMLAPAIVEDEKDLVEKVEKILETSLSPLPESVILQKDGDPCSYLPCTYWCNWCPSDAKETYNRFIRKSGTAKDCNEVYPQPSSIQRPLFKRSFSADDAPMYGWLGETSAVESRDMILLRRKDPLNYFQMRSSNSLINGRKYVSCDLTDQNLYTNSNAKSSMWGKFDGADSLWQPLPECTPLNSINQKSNIHKRGRDIRRQRAS